MAEWTFRATIAINASRPTVDELSRCVAGAVPGDPDTPQPPQPAPPTYPTEPGEPTVPDQPPPAPMA